MRIPSIERLAVLCGVSLALLSGCGSALRLTNIKSTANRPSNVAVYFRAETSGGQPLGGLAAEQFRIYEDDGLVSVYESKQTILNPEVAASHYTLLLVDMSGSVSDSGAAETLVEAASGFTERVEKSQKVAVYAFDGSEELHPISPFAGAGAAKSAIKSLATFKPSDPSTNLHGAIVKGLAELDRSLAQAEHPMRFGTLVVFTDGTDRAARVSKEDMRKAIKDSKYDVFAIGLGAEMKESELGEIGKTGTAKAVDKNSVVKAFDTIGARIDALTKSYYLLSYCSPARAGKHEVRIEAVVKEEGKGGEKTGSTTAEFDATGFTHGCDPKQPPNFDLSKGDALAPPKPREDDRPREKPPAAKPQPAAPPSPPPAAKPAPLPPPAPPKAEPPAKPEEFSP